MHPRFNEAEELKRIQKRYDVCFAGLRYTLPKLRESNSFREVVLKFRDDGWKDWHILAAILNIVAGLRVARRLGPSVASREWAEAFQKEVFTPEIETAFEISLDEIKSDAVFFTMQANTRSTMAGNGLTPTSRTPNLRGEKKYMADRWRYFDLDVPHEPIVNE